MEERASNAHSSPDGDDASVAGSWADLTLTIDQVISQSTWWLPAITLLTFLPYFIFWGIPSLPGWPGAGSFLLNALIWTAAAAAIYAVSALIHEGLHLLAMVVVAGVPISSLEFGMRLSEGVLYVHTDRPMSARAYRVVLILPAVVLGFIPAAVGIVYGRGWLAVYGYVMLISAVGDVLILQLMSHLDGDALVRDHHESIGCQVMVRPGSR